MKRLIICLLIFIIPCASCSKNERTNGTKKENTERLFVTIDAEAMVDVAYSQVGKMMQDMGQQLGIKPAEQKIWDKHMSRLTAKMKNEMTWSKIKEPMITIYMKHYSEKEIHDMLVFYESGSGKSIIRKMPEVTKESMLISQGMLIDFIPKMQQTFKEIEEEITSARKKQQ